MAVAMNLLNLPDWNIEHVEDSARDYRVHATYTPEPGHCPTCGLFARLYHHGTREQLLMDLPSHRRTRSSEGQRVLCFCLISI